MENSIDLVTALNPYIGYEKSTLVANEALKSWCSVCMIVLELGYLSEHQLGELFFPRT